MPNTFVFRPSWGRKLYTGSHESGTILELNEVPADVDTVYLYNARGAYVDDHGWLFSGASSDEDRARKLCNMHALPGVISYRRAAIEAAVQRVRNSGAGILCKKPWLRRFSPRIAVDAGSPRRLPYPPLEVFLDENFQSTVRILKVRAMYPTAMRVQEGLEVPAMGTKYLCTYGRVKCNMDFRNWAKASRQHSNSRVLAAEYGGGAPLPQTRVGIVRIPRSAKEAPRLNMWADPATVANPHKRRLMHSRINNYIAPQHRPFIFELGLEVLREVQRIYR